MIARTHDYSRLFRPVGGALAALAAGPWLPGCAPPRERPAERPPAIQLSDVTLRHYSSGEAPRIVHAETVVFNRESAEITATGITADIPPTEELARGGAKLEAEAGRGDVHGERAEALGPVRLVTGAGDVGETVGSVWDASTGTIEGSEPVKVRGPGYAVDAQRYAFQVEDQILELVGGVHVVSDVDPDLDVRTDGEPARATEPTRGGE